MKYSFLGGILETETCNHATTGWTEAIAIDKFFDEMAYAVICRGMKMINYLCIVAKDRYAIEL